MHLGSNRALRVDGNAMSGRGWAGDGRGWRIDVLKPKQQG
jgi:hypothetical protein